MTGGTTSRQAAAAHGRPLLRGVFHQYAFFLTLGLGGFLIAKASNTQEHIALAIFVATVACMFGASALHHRVIWTPRKRRWTSRIDHAGIYLLIAGSYTLVALLVLHGAWQAAVLAVVWSGVVAAIALKFIWVDAPKWLSSAIAISLGWIGIVVFPQLLERIGGGGISLLLVGGLLYTLGGVVYALRRPNPVPAVFGYHELFHVLVVAAVAAQWAAIAFFVVS